MKRLFGVILVLVVSVKLANGGNLPNNSAQSSLNQTQQSSRSSHRNNNQRTPTIQQFALNSVAPAYRSQIHRLGSPGKVYFSAQSNFSSYYNTLSYTFLHLNAGYVRWCKLVLFPFHAFW